MSDTDAAAGATDLAGRLMALFEGYGQAYGTYSATATNEMKGGKLEIKATAKTVRGRVTHERWVEHVAGRVPLGIIPIRDNDTCLWGAIDVDVYDLSFADVAALVTKLELPLLPCRTKSGGVHLFLFMSEPVPAEVVQMRLREMAALLGYGDAEVFPKQKHVALERSDLGSWLNMPYFGGDATDRYGIKPGGVGMTVAEFLTAAAALRRTREYVADTSFRRTRARAADGGPARDPNFGDGPPCLQHLSVAGFPEGTRNKGLFNLATFAKKKYGTRWPEQVEKWNHDLLMPPLPSAEVAQVVRSHEKKDFHYTCRDSPLAQHCNSLVCRMRKFGVGGEDDYPTLSGLSVMKVDPPLWFVDVDNKRLELTTEQLRNYAEFHKVCMEQLFVCYKMLTNKEWLMRVAEAMRDAVEIDVPREASDHGRFMELLEDFVMNRHRGTQVEDLLVGRPWYDQDSGRHYLRLRDLQDYLEKAGYRISSRAQMTARLRTLDGGTKFFMIKGKGVNTFWIPAVFDAVPELPLPPVAGEPI